MAHSPQLQSLNATGLKSIGPSQQYFGPLILTHNNFILWPNLIKWPFSAGPRFEPKTGINRGWFKKSFLSWPLRRCSQNLMTPDRFDTLEVKPTCIIDQILCLNKSYKCAHVFIMWLEVKSTHVFIMWLGYVPISFIKILRYAVDSIWLEINLICISKCNLELNKSYEYYASALCDSGMF